MQRREANQDRPVGPWGGQMGQSHVKLSNKGGILAIHKK